MVVGTNNIVKIVRLYSLIEFIWFQIFFDEKVYKQMKMFIFSLTTPLFKCAQSFLLHFLNIEWKPYDYKFVMELDVPRLLIHSMQGIA